MINESKSEPASIRQSREYDKGEIDNLKKRKKIISRSIGQGNIENQHLLAVTGVKTENKKVIAN